MLTLGQARAIAAARARRTSKVQVVVRDTDGVQTGYDVVSHHEYCNSADLSEGDFVAAYNRDGQIEPA